MKKFVKGGILIPEQSLDDATMTFVQNFTKYLNGMRGVGFGMELDEDGDVVLYYYVEHYNMMICKGCEKQFLAYAREHHKGARIKWRSAGDKIEYTFTNVT